MVNDPSVPRVNADTPASETSGSYSLARPFEPAGAPANAKVSFMESTSLFRLPGSLQVQVPENDVTDEDVHAEKERLVNSAWRERAFEKLADTPV